ncbi:helix-turn-helix domain-containing protein [Lutibacter sp. TH_r2]|uniref:helix-turn-helix domain-containing protein n=1 Tax=Lutibacter sp. TH_r2 TaxID=3082083 RepID=UPI002955D022|nr:helix-turn-helix domain-containing protein [Lutibacter sp. TH_r2]MDV7187432.1 helix-turn-helix domain-containing protein [Lutibacter sp. TH_r2]
MKIRKKCLNCGKLFFAQMTTTKYCSHSCNQQHYRIKKKKERIKEQALIAPRKVDETPFEDKLIKLQNQDFLSIADASTLLGVSRSTINRLLKNGLLIHSKVGSRIVIKKIHLEQILIPQTITGIREENIQSKTHNNRNSYFYTKEIPDYYDISIRTLDRHLKKQNIKKFRDGKNTYVLKKDIERIFGKPTKTPNKNG